jgi:serine/threonine-protein kinase
MPSFKAPTGETTASKIKTLVLHLERTHGRVEADDFLTEVGVTRDLVHDETRPVSVAIWRKALEQFARRYGPDAIALTTPEVVHPSNLGPWIHVVRNSSSVADAYRLFEGATTQMSSTTRIETDQAGPGYWRGRVIVLHDPALERGGLLAAARKAELAAIPGIFGFDFANVVELASIERGDPHYEYEARWREVDVGFVRAVTLVCAVLVFGAVGWLGLGRGGAVAMALVGACAAVLGAHLYRNELLRRAQVHAQSTRIRALERSIELQEQPELHGVGDLDGQVIAGLYRLHARLGAGATGVIYEALRLSDRAPVAVKLLRTAVAQDSVAADRLRREAEALRLTWHPNVVELYDHGHLPDGSSYIVMELLRGETLATRLARMKRLTSRELYPVADQICDALAAMHAAGVIHRDLKPSNIFLCEPQVNLRSSNNYVPKDPGAPRVKIFDFGIARVEWAETRITINGVPLGTPGYMSPEQEAGEAVDARSDFYALGAILYECLTGNAPPLHRKSLTEGGSLVTSRWEAQTSSGSRVRISDEWRVLIDRALSDEPSARFPDARAFAHALHALVGEPSAVPEGAQGSGTVPKASRTA